MNVWEIARGHAALLLTGTVLGVAGAAATLAQPLVIGEMIKSVAADLPLTGPVLLAVALFATDAALATAHAYAIGRAGENVVYDIRHTLAARLLRSRLQSYRRWDQGDVFTRMVTDTSLARVCLTQALAQIVTSAFMVLGGITMMGRLDPLLLVTTLGCLGLASVISLLLARQVRRVSVTNREDTSAFGSALLRVLGALPTVKASRAEGRESDHVSALARQARRSGIRVSALSAMLTPAMNVGTQIALTVVIAWGMARVATGDMAPADLTAFMMYLFYLVSPLVMLFMSVAQFQQGRASIDRIAELGTLDQEDTGPGSDMALDGHRISFEKVSFAYPGSDTTVLDSVSFTVPERGLTAVVGPSGAGKSTVFQLIERLYAPTSGTIRMGGIDIASLPLGRLRSLVGYVDQDHTLLRGTVRENLTYAAPDATAREIADALDKAHLTDVIAALPDGLDTELGERGAGLSGGQRQRLAIARALLQRPRIVLLDEATASLDGESEAALRDSIDIIARHCAVVAIAHRFSTISQAEKIIVLDGGSVQASGTHAELHAGNGLYRRLAEVQEAPA
ncbi:ABC transporter ATP-binding protein/permease (plasmid) [Streptomyces sp. BHT-5-2]|uniref:ABC transporter ATP-binding protein n=1 Tax=unclassified Streptomyces TaxID=2593676 RepID=UPI001C8E7261|nr:ABC transporter ATP-binding protein [Streptomyces sp. BHT-5-2]QZL08947.1 ABC transporter ATP-binding protein/permease [Streptomyces sp. BHT-5-2]